MIDLTNQKWDMQPVTKTIIKLLETKGYDVILKKQYQSKDVFTISKNDVETELEIYAHMQQSKSKVIVDNFEQRFTNLITLQQLKKEAKQQGIIIDE